MRARFATLGAAFALAAPVAVADAASSPAPRPYEGPTSAPVPVERSIDAHASSSVPAPRLRPGRTKPVGRPAVDSTSPIRVRPALDLTITIGAAAPSLGLGLWVGPSLPARDPTPGAPPNLKKIDRPALGRYAQAPATASDVLLAVSVAAPLVYHAIEAGVRRRGWSPVRGRGFLVRYGTDVLVLAQAIAINGLLTEVLKAAIRRPRPYAYLDPADVDPSVRESLIEAQSENDAESSFPSGHTSAAFTMATAGATLLTLELLGRSRWAIALAWIGGLSVASTTAALRVVSGRHFTSDVLTSALLGTGIGIAVPLAHWRPVPTGDFVRTRSHPRNWAFAPMSGRGRAGALLVIPLP